MQTVLVFAGIPAAVIAVVTGLVYAGGGGSARRYRPGRPFDFTPVWFLSAPEGDGAASGGTGVGEGGAAAPAVAGPDRAALPAGAPVEPQVTGGASDRW